MGSTYTKDTTASTPPRTNPDTAKSKYLGCYLDDSDRDFKIEADKEVLSTGSCETKAIAGGYKYFGLQNGKVGSRCSLSLNPPTYYKITMSDTACKNSCTLGANNVMCGGANYNSMYSIK